jgi:hypothetical protein
VTLHLRLFQICRRRRRRLLSAGWLLEQHFRHSDNLLRL